MEELPHGNGSRLCQADMAARSVTNQQAVQYVQEVKGLETRILMQELASLVASAGGVPLSIDEARTWTLGQWLHSLFPVSFCLACTSS